MQRSRWYSSKAITMHGMSETVSSAPCGVRRSYNGEASIQPPSSPSLLYTLASLEEQLKVAYKLVTDGKFSDALKVRGC